MIAIFKEVFAVDKYMHHAGCVLIWLHERCVVLYFLCIEHDHIGIKALLQFTASIDSQILCG